MNNFRKEKTDRLKLNEDITGPPSKIVRWGTSIVLIFFIFLITLSWIIKYPDKIMTVITFPETDSNFKDINGKKVILDIFLNREESERILPGDSLIIGLLGNKFRDCETFSGIVVSKTLIENFDSCSIKILLNDELVKSECLTDIISGRKKIPAEIHSKEVRLLYKFIVPLLYSGKRVLY